MPLVRYSNGGSRLITLATNLAGNRTVNVASAITQAGFDYTKLTSNDFFYQLKSWSATGGNCQGWWGTSGNISLSYAPSTGNLTISGAYNSRATEPTDLSGSVSAQATGDIKLIV